MSDSPDPMHCSLVPLSMGFSRPEYWSELPFPSPGDLPDPGIDPRSPALQADSLPAEPPGKLTWINIINVLQYFLLNFPEMIFLFFFGISREVGFESGPEVLKAP